MYLNEFGLHSRPFALVPDTSRMVWTPDLAALRDRVLGAIGEHVPLIVLTGDVGAGKTTFLSALLEHGIPPETHVVFLRGSISSPEDLLGFVAAEMPRPMEAKSAPAARISEAARRRPLLVILDEAQGAAPGAVRELCRLAEGAGSLTVLLAGQPELRTRLAGPEYRGLTVPPEHRHVIALPSEAEAQSYIARRLEWAGGSGELIPAEARSVIARAAGWVPRKINKVAEACLLVAAMEGRKSVDAPFARRVIGTDLDPVTLALSLSDIGGPGVTAPQTASREGGGAAELEVPVAAETEGGPPEEVEDSSWDRAVPAEVDRKVEAADLHPDDTRPGDLHSAELRPAKSHPSDPRAVETHPAKRHPERERRISRSVLWLAGAAVSVPAVFGLILVVTGSNIVPATGPAPPEAPLRAAGGEEGEAGAAPASERIVEKTAEPGAGIVPELPRPVMQETGPAAPGTRAEAASVSAAPPLEPAQVSDAEAERLYERALSQNDPLRAAIGYSRAAALGHDRAARYIGQKYETGDGVTFSPGMAARWYAVAEGGDPAGIALGSALAEAAPLRGVALEGRVDLVWDGAAPAFEVELGDADRQVIARNDTPLTAVSLTAPKAAAFWRVRSAGGAFSDWAPIASDEG